MKTIELNREQFACLFLKIIEECYPTIEEQKKILQYKAYQLFGHNKGKGFENSISYKIIQKLDIRFDGRDLDRNVKEYDGGDEMVYIKKRKFQIYMEFIGLNPIESSLDVLIEEMREKMEFFPPDKLTATTHHYKRLTYRPKINRVTHRAHLKNISKHKWWFYFLEYENTVPTKRSIIRLVMSVYEERDSYYIKLQNTSDTHVTWEGKIVVANDKVIIADLDGGIKKKYLMLTTEFSGEKQVYAGMYLKHSDVGKIYACSVLLNRVPSSISEPKAEVFSYSDYGGIVRSKKHQGELVPSVVLKYFNNKELVFNKVIRKFSLEKLNFWLDNKIRSREEEIKYDLFIAAPIKALEEQEHRFNKIEEKLKVDLADFVVNKEKLSQNSAVFDTLMQKIRHAVQHEIIGTKSAKDFKSEVTDLVDKIEEVYGIETYFSHAKDLEEKNRYRYPKDVLLQEYQCLKQSKAFLLIVNHKQLWSSCWTIVGWAMAMKRNNERMPIFIFYKDEVLGIPYILKNANAMKNIELFPFSNKIKNIDEIIDILKNSSLWRSIFLSENHR